MADLGNQPDLVSVLQGVITRNERLRSDLVCRQTILDALRENRAEPDFPVLEYDELDSSTIDVGHFWFVESAVIQKEIKRLDERYWEFLRVRETMEGEIRRWRSARQV